MIVVGSLVSDAWEFVIDRRGQLGGSQHLGEPLDNPPHLTWSELSQPSGRVSANLDACRPRIVGKRFQGFVVGRRAERKAHHPVNT